MSIDYSMIPDHCREGVIGYVENGWQINGFLTAVFANNLVEAFGRADDTNIEHIREYAAFLYNEAPSQCCGCPEAIAQWQATGGLKGKHPQSVPA